MTTATALSGRESAIVAEYVEFMQACNASARTVKARRQFAAARLRDWGADGITRSNAIAYLADLTRQLNDDVMTDWTISTYHGHMRSLAQWSQAAGYAEADIMLGISKPRRPSSSPNSLSDDEVKRILAAVKGDMRDWILLGLYAGLRAHEIAKLKGDDVRPDGIHVRGKGGKRAVLPLSAPLVRMAERRADTKGYWFPGADNGHIPGHRVSMKVGHLFDSLGIEGSSHRCRHTFGTTLARQGVHSTKIMELMRHSSLATTQAYIRVVETDLHDAVASLPDLDLPPAA